ncbi:pyridoxal phosphate-dependent transferase [Crepidotus variabilis]|uniref:cystathionine gamma-synthase n=1 Tax=Crepidotus variabilis TaxID=179855 RepID=A0A9P6EH51_9AGAR|nr:pyridoxal phosphate-dependent transferase [Crepidotus variabilis]
MVDVALGAAIPPHTAHAISVSLPTWKDVVGYEEGEKRVMSCMVNGYPRFYIHLSIEKLANICAQRYAAADEKCLLFPTQKIAEECRSFIQRRSAVTGLPYSARLVHLFICPDDQADKLKIDKSSIAGSCADLHIVLFPQDAYSVAKEFWQHTGLGISSRLADKCLSLLPNSSVNGPAAPVTASGRYGVKSVHKHYSSPSISSPPSSPTSARLAAEDLEAEHATYLEERYGRNLPQSAADFAKQALRSRVAGVLLGDHSNGSSPPSVKGHGLFVGPSTRGVVEVSADDVYLYPCGMAAIWNAHFIALATLHPAKSVCLGFPYTDTLKILQKWGPGCHFFGHGLDTDIDDLETVLEEEHQRNPSQPPVLALFTEFPSNPLLRSANLPRLRKLADKYDFLIVIDETIGNVLNIRVLPYADIVVSSMTKVFSGAMNVMGGSLVLNPRGRHYSALKSSLNANFEDTYFSEDAIYMERNSRDFKRRIRLIDFNTETTCDFLRSRSVAAGVSSAVIKEVFLPKYITPENYELCRNKDVDPEDGKRGGYGGLFSVTFTTLEASKAFYDALQCYKGPSLGTNSTLACPYTLLAHFAELDWASRYGVEESLVRVSVGMEDVELLLSWMQIAVAAAEATYTSS